MSMSPRRKACAAALTFALSTLFSEEASAQLALSELVVELGPGEHRREDVELLNTGTEQMFVSAEGREILHPGSAAESSRQEPDPRRLGLLIAPARLILEPKQTKLLRIASLEQPAEERVYRVTVKPVVGGLAAAHSGLKVLVGYDVLVLVRPLEARLHVTGTRAANQLVLRNDGNVSVELVDGQSCSVSARSCSTIAGGRLYVGAEKVIAVGPDHHVNFKLKMGTSITSASF